jgi:hypothetical protein
VNIREADGRDRAATPGGLALQLADAHPEVTAPGAEDGTWTVLFPRVTAGTSELRVQARRSISLHSLEVVPVDG